AVSKAREESRDQTAGDALFLLKDQEQKTVRGILRLIVGQGVTPCAHRAGDLLFHRSATAPAAPSISETAPSRGCDESRRAIPSCARCPSRSPRAAPSRSGADRGTIRRAQAPSRAT